MRRLLRGSAPLLLAVCALLGAGIAVADTVSGTCKLAPGLTYVIFPGLDGRARPGRWTPVRVHFANQGESVAGRLELDYPLADGSLGHYGADVELPAQSNKAYTLYFLAGGPSFFAVRFDRDTGETLFHHEIDFGQIGALGAHVVAILGDQTHALKADSRAGAPVGNDPAYVTLRIPFELAPDRWIGYDAADTVVLTEPTASVFESERHARELVRWVRAGGQAVFCVGDRWQGAVGTPLEALVPGELTGVEEFDFADAKRSDPALGSPLPAGRGMRAVMRQPRGKRILGRAEAPLGVQADVGSGRVRFFAFDPGRRPFAGWAGLEGFWVKHALGLSPPTGKEERDPYWYYNRFSVGAWIEGAPLGHRVGSGWLLLSLGAYFLVLGVGDYLLLRVLRRLDWMWATMAIWVALFTTLCWWLSEWGREREAVERSLRVIDVARDGSRTARGFTSFYAPNAATLDLLGRVPSLALQHSDAREPWERSRGAGLLGDIRGRLAFRESADLEGMRLHRGMMVSLRWRWCEEQAGGAPVRAVATGDRVALFNASERRVEAGAILGAKRRWGIPALEPGAETTVELKAGDGEEHNPLGGSTFLSAPAGTPAWFSEALNGVAQQTALRSGLELQGKKVAARDVGEFEAEVSDLSDILKAGRRVLLVLLSESGDEWAARGAPLRREAATVYRILLDE